MRIILNPKDGGPIKDFTAGTITFKDDVFEVNSVRKIESDQDAQALLDTYQFLVEQTPEEAKAYLDREKSEFVCEKCGFKATSQAGLIAHEKKHEKDVSPDELDIPTVKAKEAVTEEQPEKTAADRIEEDAQKDGLDIGEGLTIQEPKKGGVMR